jgi:L-serine dehydratase
MERLSIFDIYKIGVGPSSSHTLGPWKAALDFAATLHAQALAPDGVEVHLFGSLSKTGVGHATDLAVQLGLEGYAPETMPTMDIPVRIARIRTEHQLRINGRAVSFFPDKDIVFHRHEKPQHPNTLTFFAFAEGQLILETTYCSVGGGFIEREGASGSEQAQVVLPYPIDCGKDLLQHCATTGLAISDIVHQNELCFRSEADINTRIATIFDTMLECVYLGCNTDGILPGGLQVKRRAKALKERLSDTAQYPDPRAWLAHVRQLPHTFSTTNKWVSCFALAVNEQNASLGRVVTSPTNGAAGVIPAVLLYYYCFCDYNGMDDVRRFFYTSGEIGCIFKKQATISAAMGGCQAEIGVSSAMAAGALTERMGGSPKQVLMAAEIAMEHHLGLTCDPIGGLVQIPCIERNAMGAIKAITASHLALDGDPDSAIVNFDLVVKAMWDTARDMNGKYKETSEGGLAFHLPVVLAEC